MDIDVFSVFISIPYQFLKIEDTVRGDTIVSITDATGVFKLRTGSVTTANEENRQSTPTLHIRPSESFILANGGNLVGHGIRIEGKDYEIVGQTGGDNFHNGVREHYRVTLAAKDFSDYGVVDAS
jgi:hypothetical protein